MGNLPSSPIPPPLTEKNLPSQSGKVYVITGSTSGIGLELARILYAADARVWVVGRSFSKGQLVLDDIRSSYPGSKGELELLTVDFNDLRTVKPAVEEFVRRERRLDVLWNNAGIMIPPKGTVTVQGHEAQMGVNALGPHLFTKLLTPILLRTAKTQTPGATRVVWVSSSAADRFAPPGGVVVDADALAKPSERSQWQNYGMSKAANIFQAAEFARLHGEHGILSVAVDPGNLDTNLYKDMPRWQLFLARKLALKPAIYGAYTQLFAGLSEAICMRGNGAWVVPWGAVSSPRKDIDVARRTDGGIGGGSAEVFWKWCEEQVGAYA